MILFEKRINIFVITELLLTIILSIVVLINSEKIGGNVFNSKSHIIGDKYYIADKAGKITEITKVMWDLNYNLTKLLLVMLAISALGIFYMFCRYIFIPSFMENYHRLLSYIKR